MKFTTMTGAMNAKCCAYDTYAKGFLPVQGVELPRRILAGINYKSLQSSKRQE